jgi:multidrug efflux pump subunit AcrB
MTALGILILGILTSQFIPISLMPDIDIQEITVQVSAKNYSAYQLENIVAKPLRNSLQQLNDLEDLISETSNGLVTIKLSFKHGTNIDYTFIEVNEKTDRAMSSFPKDVDRPKVIKANVSDVPIFYLNTTLKNQKATNAKGEPTHEFIEFNRFVQQVIRKRIEQIPEVALVDINGIIFPEILVIPDQAKCQALGISLDDLEGIIKGQQVEIGSILVKDSQYQYNLRLRNALNNARDVEKIYLNKDGKLFQLRDIASVREQPRKRKGLVLSNDKEAVSLAIIKQSDAQIQDLKDAIDETLASMISDYPEVDFTLSRDQTKLLNLAINSLGQSLVWGIALAFLIMFFFLKDLKSPILIGITVPVSIIVCLLFFHLLDISINIISLSGLVLGIGLMIDNSIIVIDNIAQYRQRGDSLIDACVKGTNEVFRPLLSSMLTTCAVFIPLIFLSGLTGALFYDQAIAITIGLFVSLLVSILLLPVLYKLFYRKETSSTSKKGFLHQLRLFNFEALYKLGFRWVMKKQAFTWILFLGLVATTISLFYSLPKQIIPNLSTSEFFLKIDWNESINAEENKRRVLRLVETVRSDLSDYNAFVGEQQFLLNNNADTKSSEVTLYAQTDALDKVASVQKSIQEKLTSTYPDAIYSFDEVDNIFNVVFSDSQASLTAKLRNLEGWDASYISTLKDIQRSVQKALPNQSIASISVEENQQLVANKEKMTLYEVSSQELISTLKSAFSEKQVTSLIHNQDYVPILLGQETKTIKETLQKTTVSANDTTFFYLEDFINISTVENLKTITAGKEGRYYPLHIETQNEEEVMRTIRSTLEAYPQFNVLFTGSLFRNKALLNELLFSLITTLVLLYFILASQFESLLLPLIILIEIPASIAGALIALYFFGFTLNLMSMIGIIVMSGIVINDSILKIDTTIQLQKSGMSLVKALYVAGQRRLRPILMTSFTTILALVPILFAGGMGAELQAPLVVSLIGGMILGTVVSLYLIPICYYQLLKRKSYAIS